MINACIYAAKSSKKQQTDPGTAFRKGALRQPGRPGRRIEQRGSRLSARMIITSTDHLRLDHPQFDVLLVPAGSVAMMANFNWLHLFGTSAKPPWSRPMASTRIANCGRMGADLLADSLYIAGKTGGRP